MGKKVRVGIILGGKSAEHEVSIQSAKNIIEAIDKDKYDVIPIAIDRRGRWYLKEGTGFLGHADDPAGIQLEQEHEKTGIIPGERSRQFINLSTGDRPAGIDVAFPVLHGPFGEDGTVQGLLKLANIPFVGADILGSAIGMDKDVMKRLLREAGIPIARFITLTRSTAKNIGFQDVEGSLGLPVFVKPANLGSSVGISRVTCQEAYHEAIEVALAYDHKILIEEEIKGREIECSVLGNEEPIVSLPGEIRPRHEFYSYRAKYLDDHGALLEIPARLPEGITREIQACALKAFQVLCCEGMARVDFFLRDNNEIVVNEINTIPGFTKISMYPKLWEKSGITYKDLIDRLINLAFERQSRGRRLKTSLMGDPD
ncbi:MAG: D-alanine--D-alanine ligase [Pseudomonadota bacterium]